MIRVEKHVPWQNINLFSQPQISTFFVAVNYSSVRVRPGHRRHSFAIFLRYG
jgi:hypothetical protein